MKERDAKMLKLDLTETTMMMSIEEIMNHFEHQLKIDEGVELTPEQKVELIPLLCKYPILRVLCSCLEGYGYDSF